MNKKSIYGYYFITDSDLSRAGNPQDVREAVACGVSVIQFRSKLASTAQMIDEAQALKQLCGDSLFIVNDRVDVALSVDADGVHLGQDDMPLTMARGLLGHEKIIGVTVHSFDEAKKAQTESADYLAISPIFPTHTKKDAGQPVGIALLQEISACVDLPIVAIGGITLDNARDVVSAGAEAICAISAVVTQRDIRQCIKQFQEIFR